MHTDERFGNVRQDWNRRVDRHRAVFGCEFLIKRAIRQRHDENVLIAVLAPLDELNDLREATDLRCNKCFSIGTGLHFNQLDRR
jgi:hypothetical protein